MHQEHMCKETEKKLINVKKKRHLIDPDHEIILILKLADSNFQTAYDKYVQ